MSPIGTTDSENYFRVLAGWFTGSSPVSEDDDTGNSNPKNGRH